MYDDEYKKESDNESEVDSDEESPENELTNAKKNVAIIVIDVGTCMFDTPRIFKTCLLAIYQIMDEMLLKANTRNISICLLRDDDIVLIELGANVIESTKKIYDLLHTSIDQLRATYERKSPVSMRYTLTECIKQFNNLENVNPFIVILTNDEDPLKSDQSEKLSAIDVALSFKELNIKLVVLPLKEKFNYGIFYKELLKAANEAPLDLLQEDDDHSYTSVEELTEILNSIIKDKDSITRQKFIMFKSKKNKQASFFWVQMQYLVKNAHLYHNITRSRLTNNNLKRAFEEEKDISKNEKKMEEDDLCEPFLFNNEKKLDPKSREGFHLIRISDKKEGIYAQKRGFLLQFNEEDKENKGIDVFNSMWEYCHEKKRYLICHFVTYRSKIYSQFVELAADTFHSKPCFIGTFLANDEEIEEEILSEDEDEEEDVKKDDPEYGLICDVIDKMKLNEYPHQWTDHTHEVMAATIKAEFLDIEAEEVESTLPTDEDINRQLGATSALLEEIFAGADEDGATSKKSKSKI